MRAFMKYPRLRTLPPKLKRNQECIHFVVNVESAAARLWKRGIPPFAFGRGASSHFRYYQTNPIVGEKLLGNLM